MEVYEKYCNWPEWIRWILFFPISYIGSALIGFLLINVSFLNDSYVIILDLVSPLIRESLFIWLIYFTVPRRKKGWTLTLFSLWVMLIVVIFGRGVLNIYKGIGVFDQEYAISIISLIIAIITIYCGLFRAFKKVK